MGVWCDEIGMRSNASPGINRDRFCPDPIKTQCPKAGFCPRDGLRVGFGTSGPRTDLGRETCDEFVGQIAFERRCHPLLSKAYIPRGVEISRRWGL